jgi:predicted DCC family thiol-disulfide oxidoreductase YuxK
MILIISAFIKIPFKKTEIEATAKNIYTSKLIFASLWINFCIYYFYSGYMKLTSYPWHTGQTLIYLNTNPIMRDGLTLTVYNLLPILVKKFMAYYIVIDQVLTPLALIHDKIRSKIWYSIVILQIGLLIFMNLTDIQVIMLIYSLMVFDPSWIRGKKIVGDIVVYYDGYCALCHDFVKHVIDIDHQNIVYFKAIQQSPLMDDLDYVCDSKINSIIVSNSGRNYQKTDALIFLYRSTGGIFRVFAFFMNLVPRIISNRVYDLISTNRYRIFGKKTETCPIVPEELDYKFI